MKTPIYITTKTELEQMAQHLLQADAVAVDTEFFWERTFYPILGLVQLATLDTCWLVDTVALQSIEELGALLAAPHVMKILHDAPQDLTILARATGTLPRNIFDTRQSAGFAGFSSILSLKTLLHDALGIELAKTETRSNWLHRPLTDKQLQYAADDVLYLIALRDHLLARCHSDAIQSWLQTERARLDDTSLYEERDPRTLYQRVKGGSRLTPRQLAILRELAAWREVEARQRDWPRAHILGDNLLIAIAQHAPTQGEHLLQLPGFPIAMPDEVTKRIITCVETGTRLSDADCPVPVQLSTKQKQREIKEQSDRLLNYIHEVCQPLGIDPALVASRSEADAFIRQNPEDVSTNAPRVSGWRAQLLSGFTR